MIIPRVFCTGLLLFMTALSAHAGEPTVSLTIAAVVSQQAKDTAVTVTLVNPSDETLKVHASLCDAANGRQLLPMRSSERQLTLAPHDQDTFTLTCVSADVPAVIQVEVKGTNVSPATVVLPALSHASALHDFDRELPLTDFPTYGRDVAGAKGELKIGHASAAGLRGKITLTGLVPNHRYILTLNGNPARPGNERLLTPVPGNEKERYFDFQTIRTDASGRYAGEFGIALAKGAYETRCYVKDTADFKIVLYHDFFPFTVE